MMAYLVAGGRMAFGATMFFFKGHLQNEFPRYLYIKEKVWAKNGITDQNSLAYKLTMQREIFVQCLCNMGAFVIPLLVQAMGYKKGTPLVMFLYTPYYNRHITKWLF